ncbi:MULTISPECIES: ABC transporter substrate-binding protein [Arthrobacter]|uniref:ABC transporter substrate-binding protein n=2 Tax=Arthrobacter TaxID=1663 RepID=A0ABU9KM71_9MICC|nr:ABC transporter substrate-binding protein [Arthrobacter sp. YJM1]MDP5226361.1 ABC transporter substrate-binding protein [Arthrobacter sp. YJM1]
MKNPALKNPALKKTALTKTSLASTVLLAAALTLTACTNASETGTAPKPSAGGSAAPSFDPTTVTKDDALAAQVPDALKAKGKLVIGTNPQYAPGEFLAEDGQTQIGYDTDLARAIGAKLGLKVEIATADFPSIIPALGPKYDLGVSSFTINAKRLDAVNMVSYFTAGTSWAVKKGNPTGFSVDDVCGKSVGVQTGTVQETDDLKARNDKCVAAGKKPIDIVSLKAQTDVTTRLANGSIDAMAADSPVIGYALQQTQGQLEKVGLVFDSAPQGITVAKQDTALASLVQKTVTALMKDGSYKKVLDSWGVGDGALPASELNPVTK